MKRDEVLLTWLAWCRLATIRQIQRKARLNTVWAAYQRMRQLQRAGFVAHTWVFRDEPGVYMVTQRGLRAIGLGANTARIDVRTYRRDLLVVDLALKYEEEGLQPVFERELRWARLRENRMDFGICLRDSTRPHYPALILVPANDSGPVTAVEVQLANQGHPRRRRLLEGYATTPYRLEYWVPGRTVPAVQEDVEIIGLTDRVTVRAIEDIGVPGRVTKGALVAASS